MKKFDDKVPRPQFYMFGKYLNRYEQQLGWFWFKGRQIKVSKGITYVEIPYQTSVADAYKDDK